jgi:hypothetical protein
MSPKKSHTSVELLETLNKVLTALRSVETPVTLKDLADTTDLDNSTVLRSIGILQDKGYDIKDLIVERETRYVLVRYGQNEMAMYYRPQARIRTPCILTGDWHVGSYTFSDLVIEAMIEDVDRFSIRDIVHTGDFYQARGVHRMELQDCKTLSTDIQEKWGTEVLNRFPSRVRFHAVIGNHEEKMKGSIHVGHDMLLETANNKDVKNFNYYGHVAKFTLNRNYTMLVMHSSGGPTYAKSYRPERIYDQLVERPNVQVTGHTHQLLSVPRPPASVIIEAGTLQRENSYLLNKGLTAQVGYILLLDFDLENADVKYRRPKVF